MRIYKLKTKDTVEQQICLVRDKKRQLIDQTIERCTESDQFSKENEKVLSEHWREFLRKVN